MTATLAMITVDTTDALGLARWWAEQTDDPTPGKNRIHLDLTAADLDAEVARLVAAGAVKVADREMPGFRWTTLTDPAGNEFCVAGTTEPF